MRKRTIATFAALVVVVMLVNVFIGCAGGPRRTLKSTHYLDQTQFASEVYAINRYVDCVSSRFPLRANRYAVVTADAVAEQLQLGRLDMAGMEATYSSLGCGALSD